LLQRYWVSYSVTGLVTALLGLLQRYWVCYSVTGLVTALLGLLQRYWADRTITKRKENVDEVILAQISMEYQWTRH
jgi:hypothetical protein